MQSDFGYFIKIPKWNFPCAEVYSQPFCGELLR